jgi:hypothetical protein
MPSEGASDTHDRAAATAHSRPRVEHTRKRFVPSGLAVSLWNLAECELAVRAPQCLATKSRAAWSKIHQP